MSRASASRSAGSGRAGRAFRAASTYGSVFSSGRWLAASAAAIRARAARERASKRLPDLRAPGGHGVGAAQRLEGPVGEAVAGQLVGDAQQDGHRLRAALGEHEEVREAEALVEGRGAALDLRPEDRGGLRVAALRHELVDSRWPAGAGEPVEDHGRLAWDCPTGTASPSP